MRRTAVDILVSSDGDWIGIYIFSKKGKKHIDIPFFLSLDYDGDDVLLLPSEDMCGEGRPFCRSSEALFVHHHYYYPAFEDECELRRLERGVFYGKVKRYTNSGKMLKKISVIGTAGIVLEEVSVGGEAGGRDG